MNDYKNDVMNAKNLNELVVLLNSFDVEKYNGLKFDEVIDISFLPTFGTIEPSSTSGCHSWDDDHVLVSAADLGGDDWVFAKRCTKCKEADFHCECAE